MKKLVNDFLDRYFHDEESIILMLLLIVGLAVFLLLGMDERILPSHHNRKC